jgi:hypothetical protein
MQPPPTAARLRLRSVKQAAPPFHRFIARAALVGKCWKVGDRVVVYEVAQTEPEGEVSVTASTAIEFE